MGDGAVGFTQAPISRWTVPDDNTRITARNRQHGDGDVNSVRSAKFVARGATVSDTVQGGDSGIGESRRGGTRDFRAVGFPLVSKGLAAACQQRKTKWAAGVA